MRRLQTAWAMALGFACAILALSSIPADTMPQSPDLWRWDKLIHAIEYAIAATLFYRALTLSQYRSERLFRLLSPTFRLVLCVLVCGSFGILDELYQSTVPGRDSSAYDALADIMGASFASIACAVLNFRHKMAPERNCRVDHS